jgi:hypothetical protein
MKKSGGDILPQFFFVLVEPKSLLELFFFGTRKKILTRQFF